MDFNRLTIKSQEAVGAAQELARRSGNPEIYPEHLVLALLDQELPRTLVERAGASVADVRARAEAVLSAKPSVQGAPAQQPRVSTAFAEVLDHAEEEMRKLEDDYVSTEHLLLALDVVPRDALLAALAERLPELEPAGIAAGLHLVAWLPQDLDEATVIAAAAREGVAVAGVSPYRLSPAPRGGLIFGYSDLDERLIADGVSRLAAAVSSIRDGPAT